MATPLRILRLLLGVSPRRRRLAFLLAGATFVLETGRAADSGAAQPFADHDIVCFVGDSITHLGSYPALIELFYATHYPHRTIEFYDCGISGDRASAIMANSAWRVGVDVLAHHPTVATVLLGANDIERANYGQPGTNPKIDSRRQAALAKYRAAMAGLIDLLQRGGTRIILLTPSIYDDTVRHPHLSARFMGSGREVATGANAALGQCADWLRQFAARSGAGLVDFYGVMDEINAREQRQDPDFTLVSVDRLHPAEPGHFVMAYAFLKAQHLEGPVAEIAVEAQAGTAEAINATITDVRPTAAGVQFDCVEDALPLIVSADARPALAWVPFAHTFNREALRVRGLAPGVCRLRIDGEAVGEFPAAELAAGIDLADNPHTPQHAQAEAAAGVAARRMEVRLALRAVAQNEYAAVKAGVDVSDPAALQRYASEKQSALAKSGARADARFTVFATALAEPGKLEADYAALGAQLRQICQPRRHHFEVARER